MKPNAIVLFSICICLNLLLLSGCGTNINKLIFFGDSDNWSVEVVQQTGKVDDGEDVFDLILSRDIKLTYIGTKTQEVKSIFFELDNSNFKMQAPAGRNIYLPGPEEYRFIIEERFQDGGAYENDNLYFLIQWNGKEEIIELIPN